ncbi:hypothetical protein BCR37DRAFT_384965 [Protomyces lactucae-debilis]|uniref:Biogenesis of lysosome-related organelles complex 1 subunit KXD1 n=1 Tax=Protomyces lactucae-debilis TaxID=2754530 RepID=A0A1Y2FWH9_PROLT|nr:uncharacterized protein BCR37DRAFT_384965 [Protomyces lactucae-debilis]ORY87654.1 hypothetical protein BCR37DRAFT_384965 [Protomyces lactucae-debilis]
MSDQSSSYAGSAADEALSSSSNNLHHNQASTSDLLDQVAKHLTTTLHETLTSLTLDRCIAVQSQTSGSLHAAQMTLQEVNARTVAQLPAVKADFVKGIALAAQIKQDLQALQARIRKCQDKARAQMPVEFHLAMDELAEPEPDDDD